MNRHLTEEAKWPRNLGKVPKGNLMQYPYTLTIWLRRKRNLASLGRNAGWPDPWYSLLMESELVPALWWILRRHLPKLCTCVPSDSRVCTHPGSAHATPQETHPECPWQLCLSQPQIGKYPKAHPTVEWMAKSWSIHSLEYYTALRMMRLSYAIIDGSHDPMEWRKWGSKENTIQDCMCVCMYEWMHVFTVEPQTVQPLGAPTLCAVENSCIIYSEVLPIHSSSASVVPHRWIQPTTDGVALYCFWTLSLSRFRFITKLRFPFYLLSSHVHSLPHYQ